jgi:putative hydrolase of the HAD superfamily
VSIHIPGRVVVFDYGEVISLSPSEHDRAALLAIAGDVDHDALWAAFWGLRHDLDRGVLSADGYWAAIGDRVGAHWDAAMRQRLWSADFRSWLVPDPEVVRILDELRDGGTRVAILSNAGRDFSGPLRWSPLGTSVERVFVSAEMSAAKPDAAAYREVADGLGIPTDEMVFIDNRADNVAGAEALGVTAHLFTGVDGLRSFLNDLAAPSAPA